MVCLFFQIGEGRRILEVLANGAEEIIVAEETTGMYKIDQILVLPHNIRVFDFLIKI